jgi:low molecular weight protein-tyrosine phosphatase
VPPFTVLHVCMGNICRSPMAERLFRHALRARIGDDVDERYLSHGAGVGGWHVGEAMNPPAARQLRERGVEHGQFRARKLNGALVDASDLILCATSDQVEYVVELRPDAAGKTFVLGEFGRLLPLVSLDGLPPADSPQHAYERGLALVAAADAARAGSPRRDSDDLDDPWGMPDREFARVADQIEATVAPLAAALTGRP